MVVISWKCCIWTLSLRIRSRGLLYQCNLLYLLYLPTASGAFDVKNRPSLGWKARVYLLSIGKIVPLLQADRGFQTHSVC